MKKLNLHAYCFGAALLFSLVNSGCVPKIRPSPYVIVKAKYQNAMEFTGDQRIAELQKVENEVRDLLKARGADAEMRMLRASIRLAQYELENSTGSQKPREIIDDLRAALEAVSDSDLAAEWILPRRYIIMGDLMRLTAKKKKKITGSDHPDCESLTDGQQKKQCIVKDSFIRLAWYEIASVYYGRAYSLAQNIKLAADRKGVAAALEAQQIHARSELSFALNQREKILSEIFPVEQPVILRDLEEVYEETAQVWGRITTMIPSSLIDSQDTLIIHNAFLLNEKLAGVAAPDSADQWSRFRRSLRIALLDEFLKSPGEIPKPTGTGDYNASAQQLAAMTARLRATIKIEEIKNTTESEQGIKLKISPKSDFGSMALPQLTLMIGTRTLEIPVAKEGVERVSIDQEVTWTIHFGLPPTGEPEVKTEKSDNRVVKVVQYLKQTQPFIKSGDRELEIKDQWPIVRDKKSLQN